jgi:hypothetical protein
VTAIWMESPDGKWSMQQPAPYENEQALHDIVMRNPELLPLSGSPRLTVIGREVAMPASGYADVLAVEADGRPVVIEVKLKNNAESRRAVVSQALSYAASLHGVSAEDFEQGIAAKHLQGSTLYELVRGDLQEETIPQEEFEASLGAHLAAGTFRIVIVLDDAPEELINLVGYLESVTDGISLDLIMVHSFAMGDRKIAVPSRLDPEHRPEAAPGRVARVVSKGSLQPGVGPFRERISDAADRHQAVLTTLAAWVERLALDADVAPETYFGTMGDVVLLPRYRDEKVGLVSIWRYADGTPAISFWRSVFERRAPELISRVERLIAPKSIGQGNTTKDISDELLAVLREAYIAGARRGRAASGSVG